MNKRNIFGLGIGIMVIIAAFLSVFAKELPNLVIEDSKSEVTEQVESIVPIIPEKPSEQKPVTSQKPTASASQGYTMTDVAHHNSASSCWSAINNTIYDLTDWVDHHPGGRAAILMICGKDGSPLFNMQHGGQSRPNAILEKYKLGSLTV